MTVYCQYAFQLQPDMQVERILTQFAIEHFDGRQAVKIDEYQYGVDNGMNDLRAVIKEERQLITFCCRYAKDVARTESMVLAFAKAHDLVVITI
ncbi:hypothetical protein JYB87_04270 [Shewanella avicenniae]|uniref:Resolvase, N terminal domain n=1 Tax=Shewanella avicenniae TaxID=2814294 RepID=A0ABX7QSN8_9GAMM|nr:hypothetical protein [Shewanella avicenniae]QSX34472.1 hypothetical protein JYB87_04270 [Shewanella avicenniae]